MSYMTIETFGKIAFDACSKNCLAFIEHGIERDTRDERAEEKLDINNKHFVR